MSAVQAWSLIGGTLTLQAVMLATVLTLQTRLLRAEIGKAVAELRGEMREGFARIDATLAAHATRLERLEGHPS